MRDCLHCHEPHDRPRAKYCSDSCKARARRRVDAGLAIDSYRSGAQRGRLPLTAMTKLQRVTLAAVARGRMLEALDAASRS
jgi:hypothetical protein